ncbi:MAG: hypothetical protein CFE45_04215, partial [Burkholderiales bacterium PBB5]
MTLFSRLKGLHGAGLAGGLAMSVATLAVAAGLAQAAQPTPAPDPQKAFDDAKALGTQRAQTDSDAVKGGQSESVMATTLPGYTTNPPEKAYYGKQDTSGPTAAMQARCAANPTDAVCSSTKIATTRRPATDLTPASPVFAGQEAARNPTTVLGDVANTYNACSVGGELTTPAQWQHQTCTVDTGTWQSEPCTKTLTVRPVDTYSCKAGDVLATQTLSTGNPADKMIVTAYCPAGGGTKIPFKFEAYGGNGACSGPIETTLDLSVAQPHAGSPPAGVGTVVPHWGKRCFPMDVLWETPGCTGGSCSATIHFVEAPGIEAVRSCTNPGEYPGGSVNWGVDDAPVPPSAETSCFAPYTEYPDVPGSTPYRGVVDGVYYFWLRTSASVATGWTWGSGMHFNAALAFPEPKFLPASGDTWNNTCTSQEARSPLLAKDGISDFVGPAMPSVGQSGQPLCVRTNSVCTEGPSTKVIDGVPVTRECWSYSNNFECTSVAGSSTCADPRFASCSLSAGATCLLPDGNGHCLQAEMGYDCKTADAVFTPALNCGNASYCAGGSCWDSTKTANTAFANSVAQLNAHIEAGKDMDTTGTHIQIFKGEDRRCHVNLFGIDNCCTDSAFITKCSSDEQKTFHMKEEHRCHEL